MTDRPTDAAGTHATAKPAGQDMWGGRFSSKPADIMQAINVSIGVDRRLWAQDLAGSRAHCRMLASQGIIEKADADAILDGLDAIENEITGGTFPFRDQFEDIHMNVEARLSELIGEPSGRLHTARSRNDQVAVDFRLWVREACDRTVEQLKTLQGALLDRAEQHAGDLMPGFTHLQTAQPVTLGHHLMAYVEMFGRDAGRFADARARMNESPLGAAALAEEIVVWMTPMFGFVSLPDDLTTGSSIMPQKRNPDAAELVRAKTGRITGSLIALSMVMKGLPLAYSKDMQEDKPPVFEAFDALDLAVGAMTAMVRALQPDTRKMAAAAGAGFSTATDLADWLVRELGLPFRRAHHVTGAAVKRAEGLGVGLADLPLKELQALEPGVTEAVYTVLTPEASCASRQSFGGTAPEQVRARINDWRRRL